MTIFSTNGTTARTENGATISNYDVQKDAYLWAIETGAVKINDTVDASRIGEKVYGLSLCDAILLWTEYKDAQDAAFDEMILTKLEIDQQYKETIGLY